MTSIAPMWTLNEQHPEAPSTTMYVQTSAGSLDIKRRSKSCSTARRGRPRNIQLPSRAAIDGTSPLVTPTLSSTWNGHISNDPIWTPVDSPDNMFPGYWGSGEGSVISSTSSSDDKDKVSPLKRPARLERPLVGRPRDSREKCMSVSLIMGSDGMAQVKQEEVEVEFLESQKELKLGAASLMKRMVSSAGSDVSVSRTFNNMSLVNSTRGELLVRSSSQQTDLSHSVPLTPGAADSIKFVSPLHLTNDSLSMRRSVSMLQTPELGRWTDDSDDELETRSETDFGRRDDAQLAVQKLFDRKQGKVARGFVGSTMPVSPMAVPRLSQNSQTCSACQIVFRTSSALANHTAECSVKQTPFVSTDFFESLDMFGMSEDFLFMSDFTERAHRQQPHLATSQTIGPLMESAFVDEPGALADLMSPSRKRSRYSRLPDFVSDIPPSRRPGSPMFDSFKRKR